MIQKIKKKFSKILFSCATILSILCGTSLPVHAATVSSGAYTGYSVTSVNTNGRWVTNSNVQQIIIDGTVGFCTEPGILLTEGSGFTPSNYDKSDLSIIAYEGWIRSSHTMKDYLATQFMIWEAVGGTISATSFSDYASYKANIQGRINKHFTRPSFHNTNLTLKVGESVTLTDTNGVFNQFSIASNGGLTVVKNGNTLKITGTAIAAENTKVTYNKIPSSNVGTSILYRKAGSQSVAKFLVKDPVPTNINVKVLKYGTLKLAKQDEFGHYVPNTTFQLSYHEDMSEPIGTYTTGNDGTVVVEELFAQGIYVQEISVPDHLVLDSTIHKIDIKANDVTTYTQKNYVKKAKIEIMKSNNKGNPIAGAEMVVLDKDGNIKDQWITTNEAHQIHNLYVNETYILRELHAPEGYVLAKDVVFTTKNTDMLQRIEMRDKQVSAIKYDENNKPLKGAQLQVVSTKTKHIVDEWTSDENEHFISNLIEGERYILREINAPAGYEIADEIVFDVGDDKENVLLKMIDKKIMTKIEIQKIDQNTRKPIRTKQFVFSIYVNATCDEVFQEVKGNPETGIAHTYLPFGEYWIKETQAPQGYVLSKDVRHLVISENGIFLDGRKLDVNMGAVTFDFPNKRIERVKTGDRCDFVYYLLLLVSTGFVIGFIQFKKRRALSE